MKVNRGRWRMTQFSRREEVIRGEWLETTQVHYATDEFIHDGKVCDGIVVSFAPTSGVDIEVLATQDGRIASLEPVLPHLEHDDLFLAACQGVLDAFERSARATA